MRLYQRIHLENTTTIIFGMIAIVLPLLGGRLVWKRYDHYFGHQDPAYQETLSYFLKKLGATALVTFVLLWIGISIVFKTASI